MTGDHAEQLTMQGRPITFRGARVLLVERHNDITGASQWRVECPKEKVCLPFVETPNQAEAMWRSVANLSP